MLSGTHEAARPRVVVAEPEVEEGERTGRVPLYRVLLHNDDVTPMDFVVDVLRRIFNKPRAGALRLMQEAHGKGIALVEIVPFEVAELHVDQARSLAGARHFPLSFSIEPES